MEIKFRNKITDYKYIVMFDLASKTTGVCVWDIISNTPKITRIIEVQKHIELPVVDLYNKINDFFQELNKSGILLKDILVYKEAMPSQLRGGSSTVQTFVALARSHAILDLYCSQHNIDVFDYTGIYPITWHCYFKKIMGWDNTHPVDKTNVREYLYQTYNLKDLILDESDAVFLAKTFVESFWNKQIEEQIKETKRHRKTLKASHAIIACDEEIRRLEGLKIA